MRKKVKKLFLSFIMMVMIILIGRYNNSVFAEKIDYEDYIKNIRIINNKGIDEKWFKGHKIEDEKIILEVSKEKINLFWDWEKSSNLKWDDLIIETNNIEKIMVSNTINLPANDDWEFNYAKGIENFEAKADKWENGINFKELGADVEYIDEDDGDFIEREVFFSIDVPLEFTFITTDDKKFTLPWKVVVHEEEVPEPPEEEFKLKLKMRFLDAYAKDYAVKINDNIFYNNRDGSIFIDFKTGDEVIIEAIDGNNSRFGYWRPWGSLKEINFKDLFGVESTNSKLNFTVTGKFLNLDKNELEIIVVPNSYTILNTTGTNVEHGEVEIKVKERDWKSKDGLYPLADKDDNIIFKAIPKEGYQFKEWEFITPGIEANNPNMNIKSQIIEFILPSMAIPTDMENSYHLKAVAHFEKDDGLSAEPVKKEIMEEYISGYDDYELPRTVIARFSNGEEKPVPVAWEPSGISGNKLGENIFKGIIDKSNEEITLKLIMREIIEIVDSNPIGKEINNMIFAEGRSHYLPKTTKVKITDGQKEEEKEVNIIWGSNNSMITYYEHGEYKAFGSIKGFDQKINYTLTVVEGNEIYFYVNGERIKYIRVEKGHLVPKPDEPKKEGYRFEGWYIGEMGTPDFKKEFDFNKPLEKVDKPIELHAKFIEETEEKRKYTINFNTNGGNAMPSIEVEEGQKLIKPTDPTKEGHKFIGWYEDSNLTKEFSFATPITKDITLYAKWEEEPLQEILEIKSVELIKDGKIISKGIIKDKTITLELPEGFDESIIEGKHILKITGTEGTNISQDRGYDGSIEEWATGKVTNSIMPGQSAKFTIYKDDNSVEYIIEIVESTVKKYRVTFNTNGGNNISSIEVEEGQKLTKPTDPIKKDHKFIGWYEDSSLTKEFNFDTEITKDLTLYAKWEEEPTKEYTVNFNTNGGSSINSKKVKEGEKLSRPSDPTKVNYRFMGWYEDSNLTKVFNFDTPITKEITLYVKWEKVEKPEPEKPVEKKDAKILSFKLLGIEGSINHSTGKIYVDLPYRTSLKDLIPVITYSEGATISPDIGMAKDFERTVRYTLSGENFNSKTYEVDVSMPREKEYEEIINRDSNWYRDRHRDSRRSRRDEKDWYEITQEIKKERLREEERKTRAEIRRDALDEVSKITAQSENIRRDLSFTQFSDYMDIRLNTIGMNDLYKNKINIPAGVLKNLKELEFDYLKYSTGLLGIKIYPSMDSPDGVYINIKPAPNEPYNNVQAQWSKIKGAGRIFEIETNSTKAGLSIEIRLEKLLPAEYIRVVKYNYMKRQFEDLAPEKWSIIDGYIHMQQVSGGIYGVIYKR
ncbi:InlB B-repeat-containing protein [Tissierella praeacuta]|uniref:InlB B-repeat-containing protein n=1 Tax=Tissierella praeacuta TaxID=43131 RepID=UPI001C10C27F|nr:InlB B-repeat-containing protein [Tissierella praeacuta]